MKLLLLTGILLSFFVLNAQIPPAGRNFLKADSLYNRSQWQQAGDEFSARLNNSKEPAPVAWYKLGVCQQMLQLNEKALEAYQKSAAQSPPPAVMNNIYINTALIKASEGKKEQAYEQLEKAINNGYMNPGQQLQGFSEFSNLKNEERFQAVLSGALENGMPCKKDPRRNEFDFWVGEWTVYRTGTNMQAGNSKVEKINGGCVLMENWFPLANPEAGGKSFNYIEPLSGSWEQIYLGSMPGPPQHFKNGVYRDSAMTFLQEMIGQGGKPYKSRFSFFNQGADQVRQLYEISTDQGLTWTVQYDLTYKRKK